MKSRSLLWSFNYAIEGVVYALRTQRNMRIHVGAAFVVLLAALLLHLDRVSLLALIFAMALVFVTELINTAVEAAVDLATEHFDPMAKVAKDVAAGGVLMATITAVAIGYLTMFDPLRVVAQGGLSRVRVAPPTLTVASLALVSLVVLALKAGSHDEGSFLHGGWPSGHAALAFAAATVLGFVTMSASAFVLACFIALMVAQSRVESETHTVAQVVLGGILGVLIVTAVFQVFWR
jgi:diacylglycerol kinase (ATP)